MLSRFAYGNIQSGAISQRRNIHIPHHNERATDSRGSALGRIHRDSRGLRADTEAKEEASDEEMPPGVRKTLPDARDERDERRNEDGATTAKVLVHGRREIAADDAAAKLDGSIAVSISPAPQRARARKKFGGRT